MKVREEICREMSINSKKLEIPQHTYQRPLCESRVRRIAAEFDERIANEPKVSLRNGHYYVFDGQHTIAARKRLNNNRDLPIRCKVYVGLTESDEALLFAQQTGASAILTAGSRVRALIHGGDSEAMAFLRATESLGLHLDYTQSNGYKRLACIHTAFTEFKRAGKERYQEGLSIILAAWEGEPNSLRAQNVQGVIRFVDLYQGEFDATRLIRQLRSVDPLTIYREGRAMGVNLTGYKRYLYQVYRIYNGSSQKNALPIKF